MASITGWFRYWFSNDPIIRSLRSSCKMIDLAIDLTDNDLDIMVDYLRCVRETKFEGERRVTENKV